MSSLPGTKPPWLSPLSATSTINTVGLTTWPRGTDSRSRTLCYSITKKILRAGPPQVNVAKQIGGQNLLAGTSPCTILYDSKACVFWVSGSEDANKFKIFLHTQQLEAEGGRQSPLRMVSANAASGGVVGAV